MFKNMALSVSVFCLSISLIISALIIADGMKSNGAYVGSGLSNAAQGLDDIGSTLNYNYSNHSADESIYNLRTASSYLGISKESLIYLMNAENSRLPYIKISSSAYVFSKSALDKWLETARVEIK